ncbi:protein Fe65 homolog isoform X2 [Aphis gossypii]|uniref:protein Fe65 homolog isoform X2 n=1 Tax=Aphis gossypii TaxID=80765 RepID=UPI002158DE94|nr:protein Fe65 homolog isoform X2 [Aphis gossypii]
MLCGEIIRSPNRSPYATLLSSLYPMMTATVVEDDNLLENGRLSYENPNYHLAGTGHLALDDALNSNLTSATDSPAGFNLNDDCILYSELLCREFDTVCNINTDNINRKRYKSLDLGSMGVDVLGQTGKNWNTNLNRNVTRDMNITNQHDLTNVSNQNHQSNQMQVSYVKPDLIEESEQTKCKSGNINEKRTPPNTLSLNKQKDTSNINLDIQHIQGDLNNDLYAVPMKNSSHECTDELPAGWEKHEDNDGPYYWHIKSGTIQREPPEYSGKNEPKTPLVKDAESVLNSFQNNTGGLVSSVTRSTTSSALENLCYQKNRKEDMAYKRRSYPARIENENKGIRFAVRSLGWVEICEDDLTPERSSKAVNKCIVDLSLGRNDFIDNVGRWGDGKDLFMDLDEGALKLIDPENLTMLNTQPIHTIRVWGVGRDNGRDFAYVARDRITRRHMCHVFRCDMPARTIANTLRDICKKIMIERSLQQNISRSTDINTATKMNQPVRPTNLPLEYRKRRSYRGSYSATTNLTQSFPTPMEEPRKIIRATYLGSIEVSKASGMDVLNDAIVALENSPTSVPQTVTVAVAPSMITIQQDTDEGDQVVECRVRYLSFLGIGQNIKQCAFIMHTTQDLFIAHVFECDPSAATLCKTIEAACKLRYQKCLDAHPQGLNPNASLSHNICSPNVNGISRKGISSTLKSLVGTITGRKMKLTQS